MRQNGAKMQVPGRVLGDALRVSSAIIAGVWRDDFVWLVIVHV